MNIALSENKKRIYVYYIELLASVLNNTEPPSIPKNFNWDFVCRHAQRNAVLNILAYALPKLKNKPPENIAKVIENDRRYSILKETSQLVDVEKILQEFEKAGIRNIPLKGYFMKHLYPQTDFRTMTDIDILVDKKNFKKVSSIFVTLGYTQGNVIKASEIRFKKDLLYFEIHSDLSEGEDDAYKDIWSKAILREDYKYSYNLSKEDFYIYMIYHCAKHFKYGGIGIRMLMDIYVYLKAYSDLNFDYIYSELSSMGLKKFEKKLKELSLNWFSELPTEISPLGEFVLYCSTYGKRDIFFYQDSKRTKGNFWLSQIFIPYSKLKNRYTYLSKIPVLLPFSWVQYWITRIFINRDLNLKSGFYDRANNLDAENSRFVQDLMNDLQIK